MPGVREYARAMADALHAAGLTSRGAEAVVAAATLEGEIRVRLEGVDEAQTAVFTEALSEVMGPIEHPRYLVSRREPTPASGGFLEWFTTPQHHEVWHQVPTVMGRSRADADLFTTHWSHHVSAGRAVFTGTPEGAGLVRALRFTSPLGQAAGLNLVQRRRW